MGDRGLGGNCENTAQCHPAYQCLDFYFNQNGACEQEGGICSRLCENDVDCTMLPEGSALCREDCTGQKRCIGLANSNLPPSASCQDSEQCQEGLECIVFAIEQDGVCEDGEDRQICSVTCEDDSTCTNIAENLGCVSQCDGQSLCVAFQ